ncbi:MAG: hypothetical protein Q4G44_08255 [Alcaligenaceae bacterium]|nr:hypothetical protein [Alcaligenaceae bacterium]
MSNALNFQKWFARFIILFVIWNCVGLRYSVNLDQLNEQSSVDRPKQLGLSLFIKEAPSLKLIYFE